MDEPKDDVPPDEQETLELDADVTIDESEAITISDRAMLEYEQPTLPVGTRIGKYTIECVLGVGGMGAVYRATQGKPSRQVALKLIRPGVLSKKTIRRFDLEAEILGRLHHRNIAQIYEAGIDPQTGSPYFAMEYIAGQELGDFVKDHALDIRARLDLFVKLCDAIQHAHAKGVIHRDLKPANVLVSEDGEPKVLDFGIARATDSGSQQLTIQTNVGQLIGTLFYMSPEQAGGDTLNLDTRSDVYALGVVLYELLTGEIPYLLKDKALHEAVRVIQEIYPTKLSKFDGTLKGDLEVIVSKALDKEKEQRYQSVADLSADIRRFMGDLPILARAPSMLYRGSKFVRRNTRMTIAAACLVLIFSLGSGLTLTQWLRRVEARRLALDNMLTALNEMDVQKGLGPDLSKRLLDLYSDNGETLFSGDRESLAIFYTNLGQAYFGYEDYTSALKSYQKAYTIRSKEYKSPHAEVGDALHKVANAEFYVGDYTQARSDYEQTLAMYEQLYLPGEPGSAETARTLDHLGSTCVKLGDWDTALKMYTRARGLRVALFGAESLEVAMSNNSIAWYHVQLGQYEIAEPIYRKALELLQGLPEEKTKPLWVARSMHSLGNTLVHLQRYDEAETMLEDALELKQALLANNKPSVAITLQSLAQVCLLKKEYARAQGFAQQVVDIRQETADPRLDASLKLLDEIKQKETEAESASGT